MDKKKFYAIAAITLTVYFVFMYFVFKLLSPKPGPNPTPIKTNQTTAPIQDGYGVIKINKTNSLMEKLPYFGRFFQLSYNVNSGTFILTIDASHKNEGLTEFNNYLQKNGFNSASELISLETSYGALPKPTLAP